ncbi:hypothetical protein [Aquihabitans sp. McL0605]|uniref:hypothetical protein n=1 Tax=Aquihabitans sp. McL0605 TaxID=3415671 RepID=UPI003CF499D9
MTSLAQARHRRVEAILDNAAERHCDDRALRPPKATIAMAEALVAAGVGGARHAPPDPESFRHDLTDRKTTRPSIISVAIVSNQSMGGRAIWNSG